MKILCLVTDAFGGRGGIAQACRDVITAMAELDDVERIDVLPRHAPDAVSNLPHKTIQHPARANRIAYSVSAVAAARSAPDIILCNHLFMAPLSALIARLTGAKLIVQLHGIEIWSPPSTPQRRALESADALWCVSRDTRARALTYADIPPERAIVVNNSVRPEFTPGDRSRARARFGIDDETVLLTVGRLDSRERYKGHDRVIEVLARLLAEGRNAIYLIAGEGDDRERLKALARQHGVEGRVRFIGNVDAADLPDLYRAADLFVLPSTGEGFGIAFLEAVACGTPAVGLAVGGACDALADGELGACVAETELSQTLRHAADGLHPEPRKLHQAVLERFGRDPLRERLHQALRLLNSQRTIVSPQAT